MISKHIIIKLLKNFTNNKKKAELVDALRNIKFQINFGRECRFIWVSEFSEKNSQFLLKKFCKQLCFTDPECKTPELLTRE